jgi:RimJ/RimL family protein N-acetyltransferase
VPDPPYIEADLPAPAVHRFAIEEVRTRLRDGTRVLVRPIRPEDKALLLDGFERLSAESRLRRFMAPIDELTAEQLRYLTEIDYADHFAWVAVLAARPDFGVGVGRYIRIADEPAVAEAAITVVDDYQGRGLAMLLLAMLAATARTAGIEKFRAYVLEDNVVMRGLLESLGLEAHHDAPGVLVVDASLDPAKLPDSPAGRALRAVAARVVPVQARTEL